MRFSGSIASVLVPQPRSRLFDETCANFIANLWGGVAASLFDESKALFETNAPCYTSRLRDDKEQYLAIEGLERFDALMIRQIIERPVEPRSVDEHSDLKLR